jgi:hypothetical protein
MNECIENLLNINFNKFKPFIEILLILLTFIKVMNELKSDTQIQNINVD